MCSSVEVRPSGREAGEWGRVGERPGLCGRVVECAAEWERGRGVRPSGIGVGVVRPSGRVCSRVGERLGCAAEWDRGRHVWPSGREAGVCGRVSR